MFLPEGGRKKVEGGRGVSVGCGEGVREWVKEGRGRSYKKERVKD